MQASNVIKMKKLLFLIPLFAFSVGYAQIDTSQIVLPDRNNTVGNLEKPYVILISADGFRSDYVQKYKAENIQRLSANGVSAKAMLPGFPSITFPNHWSLVTGLYPAHHGVVDNFFYDYARNELYAMSNIENVEDGSWYGGVPLWSLAESQGMISASMQWVGSASDAGKVRPTYYYHYHKDFSPDDKVHKVIDWLKLPEKVRPHFISLYFPEVDAAGHYFGPDALETEKAVRLIDKAIGNLVQKVNDLDLKNVNFIFVSDHGMLKIDKEQPLEIPEILLDKKRFDVFNAQTLLRIVVKNPDEIKSVYQTLKKNKTADYEVILAIRFPKKLHFSEKDDTYKRIGQIILMPKAPKIFLEQGKTTTVGKHGYNPNTTPEMKAVFYAWGPAFKQKLQIDEFQNVNVYPLVAEILGLKIKQPIDGKIKVLKKTLVKKK